MNTNLRVFAGTDACFSAWSLDYSVMLEASSANVVAHAIVGRTPTVLGVSTLKYKRAVAHLDEVIAIFSRPEIRVEARSTTRFYAEVSSDFKGKRQLWSAEAPDITEEMLNDIGKPQPIYYWAHKVERLARAFLHETFPSSEIWVHAPAET